MIDILDYLYYRFAKVYYRWDGESGITGIMAVALFVSISFIDILGIVYYKVFSNNFRIQHKETAKLLGIVIIGITIFLTYRRYKNKFSIYDQRWRNEERRIKLKKGILIMVLMFLPIAFPIIVLNVIN